MTSSSAASRPVTLSRKGTDMLNFNRRDQAADVKSPGKIPLKPALYDAPESPARTASGTVAKSMVSAPSLHDAVALTGTRVTTPAAAAAAPVAPAPVAQAGSQLS